MIKDRVKFCNYVYQRQGFFFNFAVCASFKHTFLIALLPNFSFLEFLCILGPFAFFVFLFCQAILFGDVIAQKNETFTKKVQAGRRHDFFSFWFGIYMLARRLHQEGTQMEVQ